MLERLRQKISSQRIFNNNIWMISYISFMWSCSTLMIFSILPAFLTDELKLTHTNVGIIEGVAVSGAFATKVFAGIYSDYFRQRKPFLFFGTFFCLVGKLMFVFSSGLSWIFWGRLIDRLSKGIRSSPCDAAIAENSSKENWNSVFSFRQSFYTFGAVFGSLLSFVLMWWTENHYRLVFFLALIPGVIALFLITKIEESPKKKQNTVKNNIRLSFQKETLSQFPWAFWAFLIVIFFLMLARFSEAFLTLRVKSVGWPVYSLPFVIILMDIVHTFTALGFSKIADRYSEENLFLLGFAPFLLAHVAFYYAHDFLGIFLGLTFVGLHMGITQGLLKGMVAKFIPEELLGTGFSYFYLLSGLAVLIGNGVAGGVADKMGIEFVFVSGFLFTFLSLMCYLVFCFSKKVSVFS